MQQIVHGNNNCQPQNIKNISANKAAENFKCDKS